MPERIVVAAAVIERGGCYLITRRPRGTHLEGFWEFPGGKCEDGESLEACLTREIDEELGCRADVGGSLLSVTHDYPGRIVDLHFFRCALSGEPRPLLGQDIRWATRRDLAELPFPRADEELIRLLTS